MPLERIYDGKGLEPMVLAIIEPLCISYHGVKRAGVKGGDKVADRGRGNHRNPGRGGGEAEGAEVYIADVSRVKLDYAREFGGTAWCWQTGRRPMSGR